MYGGAGYCRRPGAGYVTERKVADPFLPAITRRDFCGSHVTLHDIKIAANPRNPNLMNPYQAASLARLS